MEKNTDIEYAVSLYRNGVINFETLLENLRMCTNCSLVDKQREIDNRRINEANGHKS